MHSTPNSEEPSSGCSCFHGSEKPTAAELAASAVLRIDKLDITFGGGKRTVDWTVDDPPASQVDGAGLVKILRPGDRRRR